MTTFLNILHKHLKNHINNLQKNNRVLYVEYTSTI